MKNVGSNGIFGIIVTVILLSGATTGAVVPGLSQQAFGQAFPGDDVNPPIFEGAPDSLAAFFEDVDVIAFGNCRLPDGQVDFSAVELVLFDDSFAVQDVWPPGPNTSPADDPSVTDNQDGSFSFFMPNVIDEFRDKQMRIQITWCQPATGVHPDVTIENVQSTDDGGPATVTFVQHVDGTATSTGALYFFEDFIINPNPDFETFDIIVPQGSHLIQVVIDTVTENFCGDGIVQTADGEECEPPNTDICDAQCQDLFCGDGIVTQPREECEPPNTDICDAQCQDLFCGDGIVSQPREMCEPPNTDTCDAQCQDLRCGDGIVTPPREECEPPNTDTCDAQCQDLFCGDGIVSQPREECEPPNTATCDAFCQDIPIICGNLIIEPPETCDPPDGITCDAFCQEIFVGGEFLGVDSTALLLAGFQANALWLIPAIAAIGVGIVVITRKFV